MMRLPSRQEGNIGSRSIYGFTSGKSVDIRITAMLISIGNFYYVVIPKPLLIHREDRMGSCDFRSGVLRMVPSNQAPAKTPPLWKQLKQIGAIFKITYRLVSLPDLPIDMNIAVMSQ